MHTCRRVGQRQVATLATVTVSALLIVLGSARTSAISTVATAPPGGGDPVPLSGVEEIALEGVGRATVAIGSPAELRISGPPDAIDLVAVTVEDGELVIEPEDEATTATTAPAGDDVQYEITVERLTDLRLRGGVVAEVDGVVGADLGLELADTTTASVLGVEVDELDVEVQDTALLRVTGATDALEVETRQAGAFDGTDLVAGTAEVEARDTARVVVNVSRLLVAEVSDEAIVEHVGTPEQTDIDVRDSGAVRAATGTLLPAAPGTQSVPPSVPGSSPTSGPDAGVPTTPATPTAATGARTFEVSLAGRAFSPAVLEVAVGDTVTWINDDDTEHTVTAFDGPFDSGELAEGASFSYTFNTPGEFRYRCLFHSEMQATVVVG